MTPEENETAYVRRIEALERALVRAANSIAWKWPKDAEEMRALAADRSWALSK